MYVCMYVFFRLFSHVSCYEILCTFPVAYHRPWQFPDLFIVVHACESQAPDLPSPTPPLVTVWLFSMSVVYFFSFLKKNLSDLLLKLAVIKWLRHARYIYISYHQSPFPRENSDSHKLKDFPKFTKLEKPKLTWYPDLAGSRAHTSAIPCSSGRMCGSISVWL